MEFIFTGFALVIYLLPSIIAFEREHHQFGPIVVINLVFGWTVLGWFGALAWSVSATRARQQ